MAVPAQAVTAPAAQTSDVDPGRTGANAQETSASPTPDSGTPNQERDSRGPDYFREAFSRVRGHTQTARTPAPAPQAPPASDPRGRDTEREAKPQNGAAASATPAVAPTPPESPTGKPGQQNAQTIVLTPEEMQRRVQSEADRILAKRLADEKIKRDQDEERELRRTDPFEYARRVEEREQQLLDAQKKAQEANDLLGQQLTLYDRNILDPFVGALSDGTRNKLLSTITDEGIRGREKVAKATLQELRNQWMSEGRDSARASLMKDQAFVKEVLARYGGQREEPEVTASVPPSGQVRRETSNEAVNDWMRQASKATRFAS